MQSNIYIHIPRKISSGATNINLISNQEVEDSILFLKNSVASLNHKNILDGLENKKQIDTLNNEIEYFNQGIAERFKNTENLLIQKNEEFNNSLNELKTSAKKEIAILDTKINEYQEDFEESTHDKFNKLETRIKILELHLVILLEKDALSFWQKIKAFFKQFLG